MIIKHPLGVTPGYELDIGGVAVDYVSIVQFDIHMNESEHDLLVMQVAGIPAKAITDYLFAPVRLELRRGASEKQLFVGTIVEVRPTSEVSQGSVNNSPFQLSEIRCLGASYKMRGNKSKVWGERTLTSIATELASTHHLSIDVPQTSVIHTDTVQINKSDWAFLNELCDTYGYCLTVHGTHLHIWDPYKATGRQISYHILNSIKAIGGDARPQPGTILSFKGSFSAQTPSTFYTAILDSQGQITTVTSDDFVTQDDDSGLGRNFKSDFSSRVISPAKSVAEGEIGIKSVMRSATPFKATIGVFGLMQVYPGGLVRLEGLDSHFDGLWYVTNVHQTLGGIGLLTTLDVVNDSTNEDTETIYSTQRFMQPPAPVFFNGEWVATTRSINVYN